MKLINELKGVAGDTVTTAGNIVKSPAGLVNSFKGTKTTTETAAKSGVLGTIVKAPFKGALWVVEQPLAWGVRGVRWGVQGVGSFYKKAPLLAVPLTVVGIVAAVNHRNHRRAEARSKAEMDQKLMEIAQIQQGGGMPEQPIAQANTYQVTPEEAKLLEQRMKGGQAPVSHADAVMAARENVATQPAAGV